MKKLMISAVTGLVCGLALLAAPAAHAQGEIETLWVPSHPTMARIDAGTHHDANAAVQTLFDNMLCYTDSKKNYGIGQRQGQYLKTVVQFPPTQVQGYGHNAILLWGHVKQGPLQGSKVICLFQQVNPHQINALLRIMKPGHHKVDCTVQYQMKKIYQKPVGGHPADDCGHTGEPTGPTTPIDPGIGNGQPAAGDDLIPLPGV